jgi:hypothetical protein
MGAGKRRSRGGGKGKGVALRKGDRRVGDSNMQYVSPRKPKLGISVVMIEV